MRIAYQDKSYEEAVNYILSIPKFNGEGTPELTRRLYDHLGAPGEGRKIIHVAGTNGKGSVCTYMAACLNGAGRNTGVFTSPHLVSIRERFRIKDELIGEDEFLSCFRQVSEAVNAFDQYHPCFFEFLFLMGMLWFESRDVEYIILETGLGGRLDATNIIRKPSLTVITRIGLDHCEYLGETLTEIAKEKAGIIKKDVPLVCFNTSEEITGIFSDLAKKRGTNVYFVSFSDIDAVKFNQKYIDFYITYGYHSGVYGIQYGITLPTTAFYQTQNASLAILALHHLEGFTPDGEKIRESLLKTSWEGRMEELIPDFYVDGAHNPDGIRGFVESLRRSHVRNAVLIFGAAKEKDHREMLKELLCAEVFRVIILTRLSNSRTAEPYELKEEITSHTSIEILTAENAKEALDVARKARGRDRIYVAGSLYLAGEYKELLMEEVQ